MKSDRRQWIKRAKPQCESSLRLAGFHTHTTTFSQSTASIAAAASAPSRCQGLLPSLPFQSPLSTTGSKHMALDDASASCVWVGGIPSNFTVEDILTVFSRFGRITREILYLARPDDPFGVEVMIAYVFGTWSCPRSPQRNTYD